jgi:four helix bundle protein
MSNYDLEERLTEFAVQIVKLTDNMPNSRSGNHMASQLLRSGTSPALNYGEAQSSESRRDFIHKMKIILKELRETLINLKIILRTNIYKKTSDIETMITECNELISIFVASVKTAEKNK